MCLDAIFKDIAYCYIVIYIEIAHLCALLTMQYFYTKLIDPTNLSKFQVNEFKNALSRKYFRLAPKYSK